MCQLNSHLPYTSNYKLNNAIYDKIPKYEGQGANEYEPQQAASMTSQQLPQEHQVKSLIREAESDHNKVEIRKMKIVLSVMVTVNIVVLMFITITAIVGGIQIQSKFERVMGGQNLSTSQNNELDATTKLQCNICTKSTGQTSRPLFQHNYTA